jgi:hypothetical protein
MREPNRDLTKILKNKVKELKKGASKYTDKRTCLIDMTIRFDPESPKIQSKNEM